jgi:chloride channel 2
MDERSAAQLLSQSCLLAKVAGLVAALGGGLSIGKEGPWVHISAAVADLLCRARALPFAHLAQDQVGWREILSAGVAAGTAANFGAPVGGVLFSIEVTATNYTVGSYLKAFACAPPHPCRPLNPRSGQATDLLCEIR